MTPCGDWDRYLDLNQETSVRLLLDVTNNWEFSSNKVRVTKLHIKFNCMLRGNQESLIFALLGPGFMFCLICQNHLPLH